MGIIPYYSQSDYMMLNCEQTEESNPQSHRQNSLKMSGLECSTLNFIKDYLVALSEYIKDNFTPDFLNRINIPIGMDPLEFIKTFQVNEYLELTENTETSNAPIYPLVKYIHMQKPVVSDEMFSDFNFYFEVNILYI